MLFQSKGPRLPIHSLLPRLQTCLAQHSRALLSAPTGSGKTTLVPLALLDQPWLAGRTILMLEPRRLAARLAARRMADLLGEPLGETVGYRIRHDSQVSPRTRIEVLTEGILTRRLQQDPELRGVGLLIFDEFHERNLQGDLALALALDAASALREDLRLLIMSATLETERLAAFLDNAPVLLGEGRSYPVQIQYQPRDSQLPPQGQALNGVLKALAEQSGDILVFLPGTGEIRRLAESLRERLDQTGQAEIKIWPLYADLSREQQDQALNPDPQGRRRIVLATSVAETSLTIEGISCVVDLGLSRLPRFDANSGLSRLVTLPCSQASADQRAGRAGRLGPGFCYRLWTEASQRQRPPSTPAEIGQADLAPLLLEVARWGLSAMKELRWLDPPPAGALAQARCLLQRLGLLNEAGRITPKGERVSGLGLHPRLGCLLLSGEEQGAPDLAADLAALLSERDILRSASSPGGRPADLRQRLRLLQDWRSGRAADGLDRAACQQVERLARQLRSRLHGKAAASEVDTAALLLAAYPDRLAQRTGELGGAGRYRLAFAGAARLPEGDGLWGSPYLIITELDAGQGHSQSDGRIFTAMALDLPLIEQVLADRLSWREQVSWAQNRVQAQRQLCYANLVLAQRPLTKPDPETLRQALLQAIRDRGLTLLPWSEAALQLRARLEFLRHWQPQAGWPDCSDSGLLAGLESWLGPWLDGLHRLDQLQKLDLCAILLARLDWSRQQQLEQLAPSHLSLPSGSRKRLAYQPGTAPVLAVRLQELFGLLQTPRLCNGQVAVTLHLLSPAQRPIQVTQDLAGFWRNTYPEVKKELKGRYPKHYWPDDPFNATATARVRPK
ncbi:ATP-dependent helicase HrpB [Magnetovirga frankeli]|uniref:ATP-dependent helicase HrpB n=1 Tax=Magnetovirga frankeli TaxID=947516 RepID=UPI001293DB92|nr:ATP-dependent helicase HrpB [gamma proteobacterium SS-5]